MHANWTAVSCSIMPPMLSHCMPAWRRESCFRVHCSWCASLRAPSSSGYITAETKPHRASHLLPSKKIRSMFWVLWCASLVAVSSSGNITAETKPYQSSYLTALTKIFHRPSQIFQRRPRPRSFTIVLQAARKFHCSLTSVLALMKATFS